MDAVYLEHHGILGQKWGVRRFQNEDGTLTDVGKSRYEVEYRRKSTRIVNSETGKKMKRSDRRAFERAMKNEDKKLYKEYKFNKKQSKRNGLVYVGNDMFTALMTMSINSVDKKRAMAGKAKTDEMLASYANTYLSELDKNKHKEG